MFILFLLAVGLLGVQCKPHEKQLLLVSAHQYPQNIVNPTEQQNVIFLTKSPLQQQSVPAYLSQNGVVYLQNEPQSAAQGGYVEPIYSWLRGEQMKPVQEGMMPPPVAADQQPEQTPTDQESEEPSLKSSNEDIELNTEKPETDQKSIDEKPLKLTKKKTSNLEDLEPDAEIIPDSVKKTEKPVLRQPPFFRPENPGVLPGQKFFILNNPQQFVGHNPFFGYSPINNHLRPQPSVRFEGVGGFPHRFLILGQHPAVQAQGGQAVIVLGGQPDENFRSLHAQKIQIPAAGLPLQGRQEDFIAQPENLIPQHEQLYTQSPQQLQQVFPLQAQDESFERQQITMNEKLLASISEQQNQLFHSQNEHQQRLRFAQQQFLQMYQAPQQIHPNLLHPSTSIHSYGPSQGVTPLQFSRFLNQYGPAQDSLQQQHRELLSVDGGMANDSEKIDAKYESSGDSETIDAKYEMFEEGEETRKQKPDLVHSELPENPAVAHSRPSAIALAGIGGSAQAYPSASAIAGPQGIAVSDPSATALAGHRPSKLKTEDAH